MPHKLSEPLSEEELEWQEAAVQNGRYEPEHRLCAKEVARLIATIRQRDRWIRNLQGIARQFGASEWLVANPAEAPTDEQTE